MASEVTKGRIVIVEDEKLIACDLKVSLTEFGYHVVDICSTGEETLKRLEHSGADLVLLDIHLPGNMDGIDISRTVRSRWNMPTIFLTAFSDSDQVQKAAQTNPAAYLVKPVRERELFAAIEVALHRVKVERRLRESDEWLAKSASPEVLGSLVFDPHGIVQFVDQRAAALLQRPREETLGMAIGELFHFDGGAAIPNPLLLRHDVLEKGLTPRKGSGLVLPCHSEATRVSYTLTPLLDAEGKALGIALTLSAVEESPEPHPVPVQPDSQAESRTLIGLAAGDPLFRRGFLEILNSSSLVTIATELRTANEIRSEYLKHLVDVVVVDSVFLEQCTVEQLALFDRLVESLPVLILTARHDIPSVLRAVRQGCSCHVTSKTDVNQLERIIHTVASGKTYLSPLLAPLLVANIRQEASHHAMGRLSDRELSVLDGIQQGRKIKEIAAELFLSTKTVSTYRLRLLTKLGLKTNAQLLKFPGKTGRD